VLVGGQTRICTQRVDRYQQLALALGRVEEARLGRRWRGYGGRGDGLRGGAGGWCAGWSAYWCAGGRRRAGRGAGGGYNVGGRQRWCCWRTTAAQSACEKG